MSFIFWIAVATGVFVLTLLVKAMIERRRLNKKKRSLGIDNGYNEMFTEHFYDCLGQLKPAKYNRSQLRLAVSKLQCNEFQWQYKNNRSSCIHLICRYKNGGEIIFVFPEKKDPVIYYKEMEEAARKRAIKMLLDFLANQ